MGRRRMVDIDLVFDDQEMWDSLGPRGILFYQLIWGLATDYGVLELEVNALAARSRFLNYTPAEVAQWVRIQVERRKIVLFRASNLKTYMHIIAFTKHQIFNTPGKPTTPLPAWIACDQILRGTRKCYKYDIIWSELPAEFRPKDSLEGIPIFNSGAYMPLIDESTKPEGRSVEENCTVQHRAAPCSTVQNKIAPCSTVQNKIAPCSTVHVGFASSSGSSSSSRASRRNLKLTPPLTPPPAAAAARSGGKIGKEEETQEIPPSPTPDFIETIGIFPGTAALKGPALATAFKAYWHVIHNGSTISQVAEAARNYAASMKRSRKPPERFSRWLTSERYLDYIGQQPVTGKSNWDVIPVQTKKQKSGGQNA